MEEKSARDASRIEGRILRFEIFFSRSQNQFAARFGSILKINIKTQRWIGWPSPPGGFSCPMDGVLITWNFLVLITGGIPYSNSRCESPFGR